MEKSILSKRYIISIVAVTTLCTGAGLLSGCQGKQSNLRKNKFTQETDIKQLRQRIDQLESQIKSNTSNSSNKQSRGTDSPIKSLTFRIGSKDDRLRIYWANGSNTDLPCTKEQAIWICG